MTEQGFYLLMELYLPMCWSVALVKSKQTTKWNTSLNYKQYTKHWVILCIRIAIFIMSTPGVR